MASGGLANISFGTAYLCSEYELRLSKRCLTEDLQSESVAPFDDLKNHEIVKALIKRRRDSPIDTKRVSPVRDDPEVYRLAYGERHRGATWFDEENRVVWLLAYAQHEFKGAGDAFPYFKALHADDKLLPSEEDYKDLFKDRALRFAGLAPLEAATLLAAAREQPGTEQRGVIGGQVGVGVAVEIVETLTETYLAITLRGLTPDMLPILLAAFFPTHEFDDLESTRTFPTRALEIGEIAFRALSE
ncbi:MAG: hypothetical protein ACP5H2_10935 [Solirubrobacteraceae bacterium]